MGAKNGARLVIAAASGYLLERIPSTRESAQRLGYVSLAEMTAALAWAVEHPATGERVRA